MQHPSWDLYNLGLNELILIVVNLLRQCPLTSETEMMSCVSHESLSMMTLQSETVSLHWVMHQSLMSNESDEDCSRYRSIAIILVSKKKYLLVISEPSAVVWSVPDSEWDWEYLTNSWVWVTAGDSWGVKLWQLATVRQLQSLTPTINPPHSTTQPVITGLRCCPSFYRGLLIQNI